MVLTQRHCFVHAGIDPGKPLAEQDGRTLRWIRDGFLDYREPMEKIIVHGHSITETSFPEIHPNRIALDSGSYKTGRISAAVFDDDVLVGFFCGEGECKNFKMRYFDEAMNEIDEPVCHLVVQMAVGAAG